MKKFVSFIFVVLISFCSACFSNDTATKNVGEQAMIEALRAAINNDAEICSSVHNIIIGAGISGAKAFKNKPELNKTHVLLTWQWLDDLHNLAYNTIVIVPEHAFDKRFESLKSKGIRFISISGVLHQKTISKIKNESLDKIDPSTHYIVMLAGDTQQENGEWVKYDEKMLNEFLKFLPQDQTILVLNGPRTGKFLKNTNEINANAHKTETDHITRAVQAKNVKKWKVIDFKYDQNSLWDAALHFCITHPSVGLILPGESTSMISEALSLGILPIIYKHDAMTAASHKYIKQLAKEDKIFKYPMGLKVRSYKQEPNEDQIKK